MKSVEKNLNQESRERELVRGEEEEEVGQEVSKQASKKEKEVKEGREGEDRQEGKEVRRGK